MDNPLRVLVVDDTVTYRKIVSTVLSSNPDVEVVGTAPNGKIAMEKIALVHPDLLLLDVEMPEMDGLEVLRQLRSKGSPIGAIMLSAFTAQGAQTTVNCLELGAFDFVLKPNGTAFELNVEHLRRELRPRLAAFTRKRNLRAVLAAGTAPARNSAPQPRPAPPQVAPARPFPAPRPEIVAIGISTGGPKALTEMLPRLPASFPVPIVIVQHMPPVFTKSLADDLNQRCQLRVYEAFDGQEVRAGQILIAPGGKQMKLFRDRDRVAVHITDDPPENSCKPSVDYLFRSVVAAYGPKSLAVIMTGMGNDGASGCRLLKARGGQVVAQDEASCVVFGMPRQPIEEGIVDVIAPLDRIASEIVQLVEKGKAACR